MLCTSATQCCREIHSPALKVEGYKKKNKYSRSLCLLLNSCISNSVLMLWKYSWEAKKSGSDTMVYSILQASLYSLCSLYSNIKTHERVVSKLHTHWNCTLPPLGQIQHMIGRILSSLHLAEHRDEGTGGNGSKFLPSTAGRNRSLVLLSHCLRCPEITDVRLCKWNQPTARTEVHLVGS